MTANDDRIPVLVDLLMGAAYADDTLQGAEEQAVRRLLRELLRQDELPAEIDARVRRFRRQDFNLQRSAAAFLADPPIQQRRLLELISAVHDADDEIDFAEDDYLRELARTLGMDEAEYRDLTIQTVSEELVSAFGTLRRPPPPPRRS